MSKDVLDYWQEYYRDRTAEPAPSRFAELVASRFTERGIVMDVGCGDGRDCMLFASKGWRVIGLDASANAIGRARSRCEAFAERCEFLTFDVDADDVDALAHARRLPLRETIVYARFFLHAIPARSADGFLRSAARLVANGARLCIECRTDEDAALPKVEQAHYRRFVVPSDLLRSCRELGMESEFFRIGRGLSPYGSEDPAILQAFFMSVA